MPSRPRPLLLLAAALLMAAALLGCRHKAHKGEEEGGAPLAGGRVSTKLEEGAKREITTLWALERRGKVLSGFGVADVTVGPAKAGEGTVEFHEREVGTSAPEWHASGRMAVCNAALIVGRPLHDT